MLLGDRLSGTPSVGGLVGMAVMLRMEGGGAWRCAEQRDEWILSIRKISGMVAKTVIGLPEVIMCLSGGLFLLGK